MEDKIIAGYLRDFTADYGLDTLKETEVFEHFINYCVTSTLIPNTFSLSDIHVGKDGTPGLDGLVILVNEHIITSKEEIDYFVKNIGRLDVKFVFIQAKTGSKFDMGEIGNFLYGVRDFFESKPALTSSDKINELREIKNHIFELCIHMEKNPMCLLYYATTGRWIDDVTLKSRIDADITAIRKFDLFSGVQFFPFDSDKLRSLYRELKHKISTAVKFEKHTILPDINHVQEAYIGILPCTEYIKLITDNEGNLLKSVFYDNIRDFQGFNAVNSDIQETIKNLAKNSRFGLLNNGITIVAKSIHKLGNQFNIKDYQVVNGCQTSHIIYFNRKGIGEDLFVPIKLIVTDDVDVTNDIIKATNWQTEVKKEAFESLTEFHKKLEDYYLNYDSDKNRRIFYERRSKQYDNQPIKKNRIITLTNQIKSFICMFLNAPHSTHRYYGELLEANKNKIFLNDHIPLPYYTSSYGVTVLDKLFMEKKLDAGYKRFKYHMLLLFRIAVAGEKLPNMGSKDMNKYCQQLMDVLWDEKAAIKQFEASIEKIKIVLDKTSDKVNAERLKVFTMQLTSLPELEFEEGTISYYNDMRGFGFIKGTAGNDIFVHIKDVENATILSIGQHVEFIKKGSEKGLNAHKVRVV